MPAKENRQIPAYWYEGFDSPMTSNKIVYRSFWQLPLGRKAAYLALFAVCLALKPILAIGNLIGIRVIPSLCDGMQYPPKKVPLEAYGKSKEDVAREGHDEEHYLSREEIDRFNRDGVIGPFRAMSEEDAAEMLESTEDGWRAGNNKAAFDAATGKGPAYHETFTSLAELWKRPEVARKLASLLGEDPQCWRSQFFHVPPKTMGTFWHQATLFREHNNQPAVLPAPGRQDNIAQLTVWCALTPAKKENACMKFLKGSQEIQSGIEFSNNVRYKHVRLAASVAKRSLRFINDFLLSVLGQDTIAASFFPVIMPIYDEFLSVYAKFFTARCEPQTMELNPGEFVIFTSATMHGSWSNTSDNPRVSCAARVAGTGATIHEDYDEAKFRLMEGASERCHHGSNAERRPSRVMDAQLVR